MRQPAEYALLKIATAFEDCANVFAPYYRQGNMSYLGKISAEERNVAFNSLPKTDILAAIDYYFKAVEPESASSPFGAASFHENDYPLYYYNIKANAATRVAAYKAMK